MTRKTQKNEASIRMSMLGLLDIIREQFVLTDKIYMSDNRGLLRSIDDEKMVLIKAFEAEYNCVVYHVIQSHTSFGELLSLLYVSSHKEEWAQDMRDIADDTPFAYVINLSDDTCSEFGRIGIEKRFGGLIRVV